MRYLAILLTLLCAATVQGHPTFSLCGPSAPSGGGGGGGTSFTDTFARANNADISAATGGQSGDYGTFGYSEYQSSCSWEIDTNNLSFKGGSAGTCSNYNATVIPNVDLNNPNQWVKYQFGSNNFGLGGGFTFRADSAATPGNHYQMRFSDNTGSAIRVESYTTVGGYNGNITVDTDCDSSTAYDGVLSPGHWTGASVEGTGNDTVWKFWDFGASDPGEDYSTWGTPTCTLTTNPSGNAVDTGDFVGLRFYSGNYDTNDTYVVNGWSAGEF